MKKYLTKTLVLILLSTLFASCRKVDTIQSLPTVEKQSTPTIFLVLTASPAIAVTSAPIVTPFPTTPAQATIEAFGSLCIGSKKDFYTIGSKDLHGIEISPNGRWIAATCYDENGKNESPLQVSSINRSRDWKIYFSDYIFSVYLNKIGVTLDRH